jgi:TatD DNase family protein
VLSRARETGVRRCITIGTTPADAGRAIELIGTRTDVFLVAGIHPHEAARATSDDLAALSDLHHGRWGGSATDRLVGVGETGLDFHYDFAPREVQERVFRTQLDLAVATGRPVVIHARKAEERVCEILADYPQLAGRVVFHCFSREIEIARRILDMNLWLSFTGVVTFDNAQDVRESVKYCPADRIMVETDAPYLSPKPVRKVRPCEPAFVAHTARFIAELRGEPIVEFQRTTTLNAERFFDLQRII